VGRDGVTVITLDLDRVALHAAARAAPPFEIAGQSPQLRGITGQPADHGDDLAATAGLLPRHAHDPVRRVLRGRRRLLRLAPPPIAAVGAVDEPRLGHTPSVMVVGRYAPSPSGHMHLGNARTALLAWLQARAAAGRFALRIEDLDRERCRPEWERDLREDLAWLGIDFDLEQQRQSERSAVYAAALARLDTYECFCTRAEVRAAASAPHAPADRYPGTCRDLTDRQRAERRAAGRPPALRVRVEPGTVTFTDLRHGVITEDVAATAGDFVVRRADGVHAYQLAVVVDDGDLGATHIVRGDDLLSSTARQVLLQRLLGLPTPVYAHVPLLYAPTGERLAKRHRAEAVRARRGAGATAEEVLGELAGSAGLIGGPRPVRAADLVPVFDLGAVA
jgi:glutamyl-tRNA synthetase